MNRSLDKLNTRINESPSDLMETAPAKSRKKPAIVLCLVVIPLLAWYLVDHFFLDVSTRPIVVTGTVQAREIPVASKVGGRISRVYVTEGEYVKPDEVLVEFDMSELEARRKHLAAAVERSKAVLLELRNGARTEEVMKAEAKASAARARWKMLSSGFRQEDVASAVNKREEAEAGYKMLVKGYRPEEIEHAKSVATQLRIKADWLHTDYERHLGLAEQGAVSTREADALKKEWESAEAAYEGAKQDYERVRKGFRTEEISQAKEKLEAAGEHERMMRTGYRPEEVDVAWREYQESMSQLQLLKKGTRDEQIARAEAELTMSEAQLEELDAQLAERKIKSPAECEVSVLDLHAGEVLGAGKTLATLTRLDDMWTRVYLPERQLGRVKMGQKVWVRVDAFPGKQFQGTIVQIPSCAEFTPRNVQTAEERSAQVFGLKVRIENPDRTLRGGMNAEITLLPVENPWQQLARLGH